MKITKRLKNTNLESSENVLKQNVTKNQDEKVLMVIPCYRLEKAPKLSSSEKHVLSDSHLVTFLVGTMNTGHASGYNERAG